MRSVRTSASLLLLLTPLLMMGAANQPPPSLRAVAAVTAAPTITSPLDNETVPSFGPSLRWQVAPNATQIHLQVIPFNSDGPGIDLHAGAPATALDIPAPPAWFGLLPDMTYTWRVRASDAVTFVELLDPSWGPWASGRFRTPTVTSGSMSAALPTPSSTVDTLNPLLVWNDSRTDVFYYEVQLSKDPTFTTDPALATAMVYWELRHGGATTPHNSYAVPTGFPLEAAAVYSWRVRPRVQGDGTPQAWSSTATFRTSPTAKPGPVVLENPALSGPRILFVSFRDGLSDIYAVRPDGTGTVNLTNSSSSYEDEPAWVASTGKVAFTSDRDGNKEIYTMNTDGGTQRRITTNAALDCCAAWSVNGSKLAFISRRDGSQQIYATNAEGTGLTLMTTGPAAHWSPTWSPDGKVLAYGSDLGTSAGSLEVFTANADGTNEVNLTNSAGADYAQAWSPDGKKLAFVSTRDASFQIYLMDADGRNQKALTKGNNTNQSPVWSPDGKQIAFVSTRDGNDEVYVMNADGSGQHNVSQDPAADSSPVWSPDSKKLAFVSDRDKNKEVYTVGADSIGLQRLTTNTAEDRSPVWVSQ